MTHTKTVPETSKHQVSHSNKDVRPNHREVCDHKLTDHLVKSNKCTKISWHLQGPKGEKIILIMKKAHCNYIGNSNAERTSEDEAPFAPALPGRTLGGEGVGTAMGTPTLPLPLFSLLLLRLLGWLPPLLPLLLKTERPPRHECCTQWEHTDISQNALKWV